MRAIAELMIDPLALLFSLSLLLGVLLLWGRWRRGLPVAGTVFLFLFWIVCVLFTSAPAIVNPLVEQAEQAVTEGSECLDASTPLVVLSGGVSSRVQNANELSRLYQATFVRLSEALLLLEGQTPSYPLFLVGGSRRNGVAEADVMFEFMQRTGIDKQRMVLERNSSNTLESSLELKRLFDEKGLVHSIRLLTSALHMQRSKRVFEKAGFAVCPILVDRLAIPNVSWLALMPQSTAFRKFDLLLHEWVGRIVYAFK